MDSMWTTHGVDGASEAERDHVNAPNAGGGARILVVEDEHLVAFDIQLRLERMGHTAVVVYTGTDAIAKAAETDLDLVLMDIKLKGEIDGVEAAVRLREIYGLPIIYLTAYADTHTLERARVTEPYGYLLKPFQERELRAAIEMALHRHSAEEQRRKQVQLQRFVAEASSRLSTTLNYKTVALAAMELIVPRYAEWCTIHLKAANNQVPEFMCSRPDAGADASGRRAGRLVEAVERNAHSELVAEIADRATLRDAFGDAYVGILSELGARSLICVPLVARDQILGALALVAGRGRPTYTISDLLFTEHFAERLTLALDNALLYRTAERAIRMRDDVLAIVSHDLRTPLATILLQAELLVGSPALLRARTAIIHSASRMDRLIGDLLDASAINSGHFALDLRTHCAADIAREALEMFRAQADARAIRIVDELSDNWISCDRDRIVQVLSNLIGNALKFTPPGGTITCRVNREGSQVHVEVEDTGQGIATEQLPHLFDRFWRGQPRNHGAGLGLFIARGIVAAHGSTLGVESKPGVGSRFFFDLPEAER